MLGPHTIVRKRAGGSTTEDEYHNQIPSGSDELTVTGCSVQPGGGSENLQDREATSTLFTVFAPLADVKPTDLVTYAGTDYAVDGAVDRWEFGSPLDHMVIRLKAVGG